MVFSEGSGLKLDPVILMVSPILPVSGKKELRVGVATKPAKEAVPLAVMTDTFPVALPATTALIRLSLLITNK